jgi:hypothetical protein
MSALQPDCSMLTVASVGAAAIPADSHSSGG